MTSPADENVRAAGGYCAVTCDRCTELTKACVDLPPPGALSGGQTCEQLALTGKCYAWWMRSWCQSSCGVCNGRGAPCIDHRPDGGACQCGGDSALAWTQGSDVSELLDVLFARVRSQIPFRAPSARRGATARSSG